VEFGYPRPQLARAQWLSLERARGASRYRPMSAASMARPADVRPVAIDHRRAVSSPESRASGIGERGFHHGLLAIEREFELMPAAMIACMLHFGAVDYLSAVSG
jgi:hypothetical protein